MLRPARRDEVKLIVEMLADDALGSKRETADMASYLTAYDAISADANNELLVWDEDGQVLGCLQLTFIPGISHTGAWRMQIESVRVARERRGQRIGEKMMAAVIAMARARGCKAVQLTTDKSRKDAHRFYKRLGFVDSHEGMKLNLSASAVP
jgi:ribosomal protein S18 acetylase RimI-like enzyme